MSGACRMELCRYWPGEGCMAGVMPCDAQLPGECPDCHGTGTVDAPGCNCGSPSGHLADHDPWCGLEPCPRGCPVVPLAQRGSRA